MHRSLLIALAACGAAPVAPRPVTAPIVRVTIQHLEGADAWEVRYQLPAPVRELAFARRAYPLRNRWTVAGPPGVTLTRAGDRDVVRAAAPVRELVLRIATYVEHVEKDYEVFVPYAGGGQLVYTGQFDLAELEHEYTLVPRAGEHVVVEGKVATGPSRWKARGDGTYAYFGTIRPVHTAAVIGVIDPSLPGWLRARVESLVPKLFELYARAFGTPLAERPVVFVGYHQVDARSRSLGGGSLPGVVQMQFGLPRDLGVDGDLAAQVARLIAHESVHLWNSQRFRPTGRNSDWLHEGGADAFSWRALRALGEIDDAQYGRELSRAASLCMLGLAGEPLRASSRPGRYKNHYRCGATIALLAEGALRSAGARDDLFAWWARVFAARGDGTYDDRAFLDALRAIDGAAPTVALVSQMLDGPTRDLATPLRAELERLGITVAASPESSDRDYERVAAFGAIGAVVAADCGESAELQPGPTFVRIADTSSCKALGALERLEQLGPHALAKGGLAAYDHVATACATTGQVRVRGGDREATVRCTDATLPPRSPYLTLTGYPR